MAGSDDTSDSRPRRLTTLLWAGTLLAAVYVLGYVGFWLYEPPGTAPADGWLDLAYYDLQIFALEFNARGDGTPVPWALQAARILAPIVLAGAVVSAVVVVQASLWWRRTFRSDFALVVGDTVEAETVAVAMRQRGRRVFRASGKVRALRDAGIRKARLVFALGDDGDDVAANIAAAFAAGSASESDRRIFVHVTHPDLAVGLRARRLMQGRNVEFFNMDEVAARNHVRQHPLDADARPEILVAGAGAFGRAIVVALAQQFRDDPARVGERLKVTLVDEHASRAAAELADRWLVVHQWCDLASVDEPDLVTALREHRIDRPYRSYICYQDEHAALRCALAATALWHGRADSGSVVVRLSQLQSQRSGPAFPEFGANGLLDDLGGRLIVANVATLAAHYVADEPDVFEELAQAIHQQYLGTQLAPGQQRGDRPSQRPWDELSDVLRDSNRDQARDLPVKLAMIGVTLAPRSVRGNTELVLGEDEVELLAQEEHDRWVAFHVRQRVEHDKRVPWSELTDEDRDKDRATVRAIPTVYDAIFADFGLQVVRL